MSWRRALLLASAVLPAAGAWFVARASADSAASRIAGGALTAAAVVEWLHTAPSTDAPIAPEEAAEPVDDTIAAESSASAPPGMAPRRPAKASGKLPPRRGILVRRSAVASAVRRGVRPSAGAVAATAEHPAGLIVHGWGAAGTGLRDGDIIVSVGGRTPSSVDDVVAAVAGAYRHHVYAVSGRIWRAGETIDVSVELPMPRDEQDGADGEPSGKLSRNGQRMPRSTGGP